MDTPPEADDLAAGRADLRYLGRLLGDVIRAQEGSAAFDAIEGIRRASVAAHRAPTPEAAADLETRLKRLDLADTLRFVRGFLLFSLLGNLAEDRRRPAGEARAATLAGALDTLAKGRVEKDAVAALLEGALIAPVLTAHIRPRSAARASSTARRQSRR